MRKVVSGYADALMGSAHPESTCNSPFPTINFVIYKMLASLYFLIVK